LNKFNKEIIFLRKVIYSSKLDNQNEALGNHAPKNNVKEII